RTAVVHCPGSHDYFRHKPFPYRQMKKRHIPVCLGTDSLASNRSLSLFREMRLFQKNNPQVPAQEILSLATVKAAQALGMGDRLGQIKPGFLADIIGIPLPRKLSPQKTIQEQLLGYRGTVAFSMIHGELRFRVSS